MRDLEQVPDGVVVHPPALRHSLLGLDEGGPGRLNLTPWKMWNLKTGGVALGAGTLEAMEVLEGAFRDFPAAWQDRLDEDVAHLEVRSQYIDITRLSAQERAPSLANRTTSRRDA